MTAEAWITGTPPNQKINFRLPTGPKGVKGDKGDPGLNGSNVLPTSEAIEQALTTDGPAKTTLSATIADSTGGIQTDAFAVQRLDRQGIAAARTGSGDAAIEYADATQVVEDWADLTGFATSAAGAVSGNKFYSSAGTTAAAHAVIPFTVAPGETAHVTTVAHWKVGNTSSNLYFGLNTAASPTPAAPATDGIFIGVGSGSVRATFIGSNTTASATVLDRSVIGPEYTVDTDIVFALDVDDNYFSLSARKVGSTTDFHTYKVARGSLAVNAISVYTADNRTTLGHSFEPVVAVKSLQPTRTKTIAGVKIEGKEHRHLTTRSALADKWRVQIPAGYDPRKPAPVAIFSHQSVTGTVDTFWSEARSQALADALGDAGYIVAAAHDGGDRWGNRASIDNYRELYGYVRNNFATGPLFLIGASMGFLPVLNALAYRDLPTPAAVASIAGVSDLDTLYKDQWAAGIRTAYGIAADGSDYDAKTAGYNPMDRDGVEFRGVPMRFYSSTGDTTVPPATNADLMAAKVAPYAPEAAVVVKSGAHLDPTQYDAVDLLAFFGRYGG